MSTTIKTILFAGMSTSRDRDSGDTKDAAVPILIPGMVHHTQKGKIYSRAINFTLLVLFIIQR